jgi:ferredoxin
VIIECTGVNGKYKETRDVDEGTRMFVPCLGCLSVTHLLLSQLNTIDFESCSKACPNYRGAAAYSKTTRIAEHITRALQLKEREPGESELLPVKTMPLATRRQFLNNIGLHIMDTFITSTIGDLGLPPNREHHQLQYSRRKYIIELGHRFGTSPYTIVRTEAPFANISINEKHCTLCGICSHVCPTNALQKRETSVQHTMLFEFGLCTGCTLCREVCPEKAVQLCDSIDFMNLTSSPQSLIEKKVTRCLQCRAPFLEDNDAALCLSCRRRKQVLIPAAS